MAFLIIIFEKVAFLPFIRLSGTTRTVQRFGLPETNFFFDPSISKTDKENRTHNLLTNKILHKPVKS